MRLKLHVWRQENAESSGKMVVYDLDGVDADMSFLEMLDVLNHKLVVEDQEPIAFDHDCREGICGMCSLVINGRPHGNRDATTTCQLHMREFKDGQEIYIEPFRAKAFPVVRDLVVDRSSFDRVIQAGGYISVNTGNAPDANASPISKVVADAAFDAAACIGCGACVASCKNASAMLFVSAKVGQLSRLPQGQPERLARARAMVDQMDSEGFGACTNQSECEAVCPKEIRVSLISDLNREYTKAVLTGA